MLLLVTTKRFLLAHDTGTAQTQVLESGRGEYYGISWSPDGTALALGHTNHDTDAMVDLTTYALSERGTVTVGDRAASTPFLSAPHQILWIDEDRIAATNTGRNSIAIIRVSDGSVIERRVGLEPWDRMTPGGREGAHVNSLFRRGDRLYAVAHNFDKGSYVVEWSWPALAEIAVHPVPNLTGIHNLLVTGEGDWIVCDSFGGGLADGRTGTPLWKSGGQGYLRGLAASDAVFAAGHSELAGRADRHATESGVWLIDRKTMLTLDYIYLGHFGPVHEVRIADEPDFAHHGNPLAREALQALSRRPDRISARRLSIAARQQSGTFGWTYVVGTCETDDDGAIVSAENLAIARIDRTAAVALKATIRIDRLRARAASGAHVSLVARYRGPADTNLVAALFQVLATNDILAGFWINQDGDWTALAPVPLPHHLLRMEGSSCVLEARLAETGNGLVLEIAGMPVLTLRDAGSSLPAPGGHFAIRLVGTGITVGDLATDAA